MFILNERDGKIYVVFDYRVKILEYRWTRDQNTRILHEIRQFFFGNLMPFDEWFSNQCDGSLRVCLAASSIRCHKNVQCTLYTDQPAHSNQFFLTILKINLIRFIRSVNFMQCVECYISRSREYSFFFLPSLNFSFLVFLRKNSILIHLSCICILIVVQTCLAKRNFIERLHNIRRLFSSGCLLFLCKQQICMLWKCNISWRSKRFHMQMK